MFRKVLINLREFQSVRDFLKSKGIHNGSPASEVLQWVPSNIVLRMWPSRVQGRIGADAEGGSLAFNIVSSDSSLYIYASFLIVTDLRGENVTVKVIDAASEEYGHMHFDGLKVRTQTMKRGIDSTRLDSTRLDSTHSII